MFVGLNMFAALGLGFYIFTTETRVKVMVSCSSCLDNIACFVTIHFH